MAGIKRKEAPKAVAAVRSGSEKKQKLGSFHKKSTPVEEVSSESETSEEEDDDDEEEELDGDDDAMSGVELENGNSESDEKKIRSA
jgi:pumilio family protein 6